MANETYCGLVEHQHTAECYEEVLICGISESAEHTHSEECYEEQLVCGLIEHTHTADCLSDGTEDVEYDYEWEEDLPEPGGVWTDDLVAVAQSQLGYTESESNFVLADDGETHKGYTRYGEWYGNAYGDWDAMFVSFCLYYAGVPEESVYYESGAYAWTALLQDSAYYKAAADDALTSGDLVFFDRNDDDRADAVGIAVGVSGDEMTVIEGDSNDQVEQNTYSVSSVFAYVDLAAAYEAYEASLEEATTAEEDSEEEEPDGEEPDGEEPDESDITVTGEDEEENEAPPASEESEDVQTEESGIAVAALEEQEEADPDSSDENDGISTAAETDEGISAASISGDTTVAVGSSITLTSDVRDGNNHSWTSSDTSIAMVSGSGTSATVTGVSEGSVTITHTYTTGHGKDEKTVTERYTVTVTAASSSSDTITVYVYVSASGFSDELLEILGVSEVSSGYFAAGTVQLDMSQLSGSSTCKITSESEWNYVISALQTDLDTSTSQTCQDNHVASYAEFVCKDLNVTQGNGYSGLWVSNGHSQIDGAGGTVDSSGNPTSSGSQYWHLDLRFETVTITFKYGNNGITEGTAADDTTAGTEVFIKGAIMNYTPSITVPDDYMIEGYYTDADFTTEWDGFNVAIDTDTTVYIKLVPITYELPSTGGMGTDPFALAGLVLAGGAAGAICRRKKTEREEV